MPDPNSCACGAHVTDPDALITHLTDGLIDLIFDGVVGKIKYLGLLASLVDTPVDVAAICAAPKPAMPEMQLQDWINFGTGQQKLIQLLTAKIYELNCTCDDCPPATDCGDGTCYGVSSGDGYQPDPDEPGVRSYVIPPGTGIWAARATDSHCWGWFSGINITWHIGGVFDPTNAVSVCDGNGANCHAWGTVGTGMGGGVQLCIDGAQDPPTVPVPEPPNGIDDTYGPPDCSPADICTALDFVYKAVRRIEFMASVLVGPMYGITTDYTSFFPGAGNVTGPLATYLPRALSALAPIAPSQLISPTVTAITEGTLIDVTGRAYVNIVPVEYPVSMGHRGADETTIIYANHRNPGPGWAIVMGQEGVLAEHTIVYPSGVEFALPSTATDLAIEVGPSTTISVTTWSRQV